MGNTIDQQALNQNMMIKIRNALLAMALISPGYLLAEQLDRNVLEAPGTIWISDDVTTSAKGGLSSAGIPVAIFHDGRLTDDIAAGALIYADGRCPYIDNCGNLTNRVTIHIADYKIDGDTLVFSKLQVRDITSYQSDEAALLHAETLAPYARAVPARMEDRALIVDLAYETRRYLPFPEESVDQILGIRHALGTSPVSFSSCIIQGLHTRLNLSESDRSPLDEQMLDFAEYSAIGYRRFVEGEKIFRSGYHLQADWSQEETDLYRKLEFTQIMAKGIERHLIQVLHENKQPKAGLPIPDDDTLWKLAIDQFPKIPAVVQKEQEYFRETLRQELRLLYSIAPTVAKLSEMAKQGGGEPLRQLLCP